MLFASRDLIRRWPRVLAKDSRHAHPIPPPGVRTRTHFSYNGFEPNDTNRQQVINEIVYCGAGYKMLQVNPKPHSQRSEIFSRKDL